MFGFDAPFKALADPRRRAILDALGDGPINAGELAEKVGLAPNALSFHLRVLKNADLVVDRRQGQFVIYTLNTTVLQDIAHFIFDRLGDSTASDAAPPTASPDAQPIESAKQRNETQMEQPPEETLDA